MKIKGAIVITGISGIGKSSLAQECGVLPGEMVVFNLDVKPYDLADQFKFYREYNYIHADITSNDPQMALVQAVLDDLESAPSAQVLILDAWEAFEKSFGLYVEKHISRYRKNFYATSGKQAVFERRGYVKSVAAGLLGLLQQKFGTIFVINHLTDEWDRSTDKKTGRQVPISSVTSIQKAAMRLWLIETQEHRCPTALVIKDVSKHVVENGKIVTIPFMPPKVSPLALPGWEEREHISFWDVFDHYWENPVGRRLQPFERLTSMEESLISAAKVETFSHEDQEEMDKQIQANLLLSDSDLIGLVESMIDQPLPKILLAAKKINRDVTLGIIRQMSEELKQ